MLVDALRAPEGMSALLSAAPDVQERVHDLAAAERVLAVLGSRMLAWGLAPRLPDELVAFLANQGVEAQGLREAAVIAYQANEARVNSFRSQLQQVGTWLDEANVDWIPLKGAALLLAEVWPTAAERVMTDLDILVLHPGEAERAHAVLRQRGMNVPAEELLAAGGVLSDRHQLDPLVADGWVGSVEIHRALVMDEFESIFPTEQVVASIQRDTEGSRLCDRDLALHIIFHAQISDWGHRAHALSLRSLLDIGYLVAATPQTADKLLSYRGTSRVRRAIRAHLGAAASVSGSQPLQQLRTGPRAACWWRIALLANWSRRTSVTWRNLMLWPVFVRPTRVSARAGRRLSVIEFLVTAAAQSVRRIRRRGQGGSR